MTAHSLGSSPSGLWSLAYNDDAENITYRAPKARLWKFTVDEPGTLAHFSEIAEAFAQEATPADLIWLAATLASIETWLETCPHDLATHGEIGVSY